MRIATPLTLICLVASVCFAQQPPMVTKEHQVLKKDVGTWTGTMKMYGANPTEFPVKEINTVFGGGLWVLSEFDAGPFKGRGQFGYDVKKMKYTGTWIDNFNPFMSVMEGDFDAEKSQMVMQFQGIDPASGNTEEMKTVTTHDGDDKRNFVMYTKKDGDWEKAFEIDYQRAK